MASGANVRDRFPPLEARSVMHTEWSWHSARHGLTETAWWAAGSFGLALIMWAFLNGPRLRALEEQEIASEQESENRDVCERLKMPSGGAAYSACAAELGEVRRQEKQRMERYATGML